MKIVSFIERSQSDLIERILRHCGLWEGPLRTLANPRAPPGPYPTSAEPGELQLILDGDFLDAQRAGDFLDGKHVDAPQDEPGELQLILDPWRQCRRPGERLYLGPDKWQPGRAPRGRLRRLDEQVRRVGWHCRVGSARLPGPCGRGVAATSRACVQFRLQNQQRESGLACKGEWPLREFSLGHDSIFVLSPAVRAPMLKSQGHRKQVKHFHEPGDFHELTFSCYRRMPLLTNDLWRRWLAEIIDEAAAAPRFHLNAFVFMPEHVHLLVWPTDREATADDISTFLAAVKRPLSRRVKAALKAEGTKSAQRLLERLTVRTRPGKTSFRFWQEGSGYDRNLQTEKSVMASIDYIHDNPVKRRLVKIATKWKWSSARWYVSEGKQIDAELPQLHFPSAELFYSGT